MKRSGSGLTRPREDSLPCNKLDQTRCRTGDKTGAEWSRCLFAICCFPSREHPGNLLLHPGNLGQQQQQHLPSRSLGRICGQLFPNPITSRSTKVVLGFCAHRLVERPLTYEHKDHLQRTERVCVCQDSHANIILSSLHRQLTAFGRFSARFAAPIVSRRFYYPIS